MANQQQVDMLLNEGVAAWNQWREENPDIHPDLTGANLDSAYLIQANFRQANLAGAYLKKATLRETNLREANLSSAYLSWADFTGANLYKAKLYEAQLREANLTKTYLVEADLTEANLYGANLSQSVLPKTTFVRSNLAMTDLTMSQFTGADFTGATLSGARCLMTDFSRTTLTGCNVYGIAAWDVTLKDATQADLRISFQNDEVAITVDNLEVAQFLHMLLRNEKMRAVLDTITSKVVLILGRFSEERKPILDALREALRHHPNGYIPVLFDFDPQTEKPVLDTVKTLANLARFVIADLTDPNMVRSELTYITANLPTVPVQPLIEQSASLPTEYTTWANYRSFLPVYRYADLSHLLANLTESVITPVERHVQARRI